MPYIDKSYYDVYNPPNDLDESEFQLLEARAEDIINSLVFNKIEILGFNNFSEFTKGRIQKAVAAQVDTLNVQGGIEALTGQAEASTGGFSIGKFSMSAGKGSGTGKGIQLIDGIPISPLVNSYLIPTNLLNPTLNTCLRLEDFT